MGKARAQDFGDSLLALGAWFERQKRVLPWRDQPTFYRVWISEIMLQQTQVVTVVPFFERFLARFPDVHSLAAAPGDEVMRLWAGLGYYSRARNLHRAAALLARDGFPQTREGWLEIPGVGPYTAGAILSIAADEVVPILDGNVERVLSRVRRVNRPSDSSYKARLWRLARAFVERGHGHGVRPSVLNQALMELGATVCTPRAPACPRCPLSGICRARAAEDAAAYPPRKPPRRWKEVREELHCWLDAQGRVFLRRRATGEWRAGLWDLLDEAPARGARQVGVVETKHIVTNHRIRRRTTVWKVATSFSGASRTLKAAEVLDSPSKTAATGEQRWISIDEPEVAVGSALKRTLARVQAELPADVEGETDPHGAGFSLLS